MSGGSITYGGSDTMSNSRGAVLAGDGSGGGTGYGSRGAKKAVHPHCKINEDAKQNAQADSVLLRRLMAYLGSSWEVPAEAASKNVICPPQPN